MDRENGIVTITVADIGSLEIVEDVCVWCLYDAPTTRIDNGDKLCDDCADMARDVGDGTLIVSEACHEGRRATVSPPLELIVVVQHNNEGARWLEAIDPDPRNPFGLFGTNSEEGRVDGGTRAELVAQISKEIVTVLDYCRETIKETQDEMEQNKQDQDALIYYRERIEEVATRYNALKMRVTPYE